jgi:hypothetical protein
MDVIVGGGDYFGNKSSSVREEKNVRKSSLQDLIKVRKWGRNVPSALGKQREVSCWIVWSEKSIDENCRRGDGMVV